MLVNEEFKKLVLSDENLLNELRVFFYMIYNKHNNENKEEYALNKDNYDFFCWYINEDEENKELKDYLTDVIKKIINDDLFNNFYNFFEELNVISEKNIIYSLSRLLYTQNKFKNNSIGQELDQIIKSYIDLLKTTPSNYTEQLQKIDFNNIPQEQLNEINKRLGINNLTHVIININYDIYKSKQDNTKIMSLWIENINKQDLKNFFDTYINNIKQDLETRDRQLDKISNIINSTIEQTQFNNFFEANINIINDLKNKTHNIDTNKHLKSLICIKRKYIEKGEKDEKLDKILNDDFLNKMYDMYLKYQNTQEYKDLNLTNDDILIWREKADKFINHLETYKKDANINTFNLDYMLKHLAYSDYQKKNYKLNLDDEIQTLKVPQNKEIKHDNKLLQATSKQLKAIDNARGGLVTYNESDTQAIKNKLKEKQESLKNTHIKQDKARLKKDIEALKSDLVIAEQKEDELKAEYKNVCDYLENIYKSMTNEPKTSSYYKDLKKAKKEQEQRKKEIERIIRFNGWQLDLWGNGSYELVLNKRQKESLKLTIENLSKQIAKYTKEEQDIFDFLISKYLHNTDIKEIKFTLREYEETKKRVRPTNYLMSDIQAIRLLFREVWTYYTTNDKTYTFNEEHLFTKLNIKGELESDLNNLNNANLDTEISLEPTETLQNLLQDHDNYLYISTSLEIMQLNNDNEYLAKRLLKYLNYLARVNKESVFNISLDTIIEELQHYGLKRFNMLDRHKTYKTEIVDVIDKTLSILEGENHLNKRFIEVLDRQPFINYDNEYRGKSQETNINEWGKHKIKIKVFDLDDTKLLKTKQKQSKKKHKATKK